MNRKQPDTKKTRFNIIDVVIILAVLAAIAGVVVFVLVRNGTVKTNKTVRAEYTVRFTGVREEFLSEFSAGKTVKNSSTRNDIGTILAVRTPTKTLEYNTDAVVGEGDDATVLTSELDTYDVYVTISSTATLSDIGIAYIDGTKVLIGSPAYYRIDRFAQIGYITDFELIAE